MDVIELEDIGKEGREEERVEQSREEKDREDTSLSENTKDNYDNTRSRINTETATQSETRTDLEDFDTADLTRRLAKDQQDKETQRDGAKQILEIITREKKFGDYGEKSRELLDNLRGEI